jgi:hypothetical protein
MLVLNIFYIVRQHHRRIEQSLTKLLLKHQLQTTYCCIQGSRVQNTAEYRQLIDVLLVLELHRFYIKKVCKQNGKVIVILVVIASVVIVIGPKVIGCNCN